MTAWLYLSGAIAFEVAGTTALKLSDGMTRPGATLVMALCYGVSFLALALARALRGVEVGVAYAVWAGAGTALVAAIGVLYFREAITLLKFISLGLIILGVVGLKLSPTG